MLMRSRVLSVLLLLVCTLLVGAVGEATAATPAASAAVKAKAKAKAKAKPKHKKHHPKKQAPAASATQALPVSFTVRNTNTSLVPCTADGKAYEVKGHLVGPASRLSGAAAQAGTLYVHGLGYGEFFYDYKGVPGYDYAAEQAAHAGQVSVVIDRLGYGASGRPDGNAVCYGSEADYLHQIITQLRSGKYAAGTGATGPVFNKVALAGHSAAGYMVQVEAASYHDVDALMILGFGDVGPSVLTLMTFGQTALDCYTAPLPGNYAYFGKTPADFRSAHFFNADPVVADKVTAIRAPDPCMDTGSAPQAIVADLLRSPRIKVPVLVVNGSDDAIFTPPTGAEERFLFSANPDATQVTLADSGHALTLGRTAPQFRALTAAWLKRHGY